MEVPQPSDSIEEWVTPLAVGPRAAAEDGSSPPQEWATPIAAWPLSDKDWAAAEEEEALGAEHSGEQGLGVGGFSFLQQLASITEA